MESVVFSIPPQYVIQLLIAVLLPALVGLVTTRLTHPGAKAGILALLSVISAGLTELGGALATDTPFDVGVWIVGAVGTVVAAISIHYGLMKPTGAADAVADSGVTPKG